MKKFIFLAMFIMISATISSAQSLFEIHQRSQIFKSVPTYSTGQYTKMVWNTTSNRVESTSNTSISGVVTIGIEKDSARIYTHLGSYLTYVKYTVRDTISLTSANYTTNQTFKFVVTASGADTTVFIPSSGNINGSSTYTMTGTNNALSVWFDGTNYWILK